MAGKTFKLNTTEVDLSKEEAKEIARNFREAKFGGKKEKLIPKISYTENGFFKPIRKVTRYRTKEEKEVWLLDFEQNYEDLLKEKIPDVSSLNFDSPTVHRPRNRHDIATVFFDKEQFKNRMYLSLNSTDKYVMAERCKSEMKLSKNGEMVYLVDTYENGKKIKKEYLESQIGKIVIPINTIFTLDKKTDEYKPQNAMDLLKPNLRNQDQAKFDFETYREFKLKAISYADGQRHMATLFQGEVTTYYDLSRKISAVSSSETSQLDLTKKKTDEEAKNSGNKSVDVKVDSIALKDENLKIRSSPPSPTTAVGAGKSDSKTFLEMSSSPASNVVPFDILEIRTMVLSTTSHLRQLPSAVQAYDAVLELLVEKAKECPSLPFLYPCKRSRKDWLSPTVLTQNKFILTFICPVSLCVVECGPGGLGWEVAEPKEWVKKWGPALLITLKVLHVAAVAGRVLGVPVPSLSSSEALGLGVGSGKEAFLNKFLGQSWNQIASQCNVDEAFNSLLKSGVKPAAIPPPGTTLKHTEEAYAAIHSFLLSFGEVDDLFRGMMSRVKHLDQVEWVSTEMIQRWKDQIDERARTAAAAAYSTPPIANPQGITSLLQTSTFISGSSSSDTAEPLLFPWLADKFKANTKMQLADVESCIHLLVKDGISDESILRNVSPDDFTAVYLKSIGISSLGAQQQLLKIHRELVQQALSSASKDKRDDKIVDPADAQKVAALENELKAVHEATQNESHEVAALEKGSRAVHKTARKMAKNSAGAKSIIDVIVDPTSDGNKLEVVGMADDGKKIDIVVSSPRIDGKVNELEAEVVGFAVQQEPEMQELREQVVRPQQLHNQNKGCCIVS